MGDGQGRAAIVRRHSAGAFSVFCLVYSLLPSLVALTASAQQRPVIVQQPPLITYVAEHDTATFAPTIAGDGLVFSWWMRSVTEPAHAIPDDLGFEVHDMTLEVPNSLNNGSYNGVYWLVAANAAGTIQTRRARLIVVPEPQIIATSPDRVVRAGGSTIVWVKVAPDHAPVRTFQWFKDGAPVRAGRMLYLHNIQPDAAGEYDCVVTTVGGTTTGSVSVTVQ
jgi:hypothetical protein